jgi:hypothetical protein
MKKVAEEQSSLIYADDEDAFLKTSALRNKLQQRITANVKLYDTLVRESSPGHIDSQYEALKRKTIALIREIEEIDCDMERLIHKRREGLMMELKKARNNQRALRGYGGRKKKAARFIQRKG